MPETTLAQDAIGGDAVGTFFIVLFFWVPAAWIYFDAEERGLSSYLWGGLALGPFTNLAVVIFYFRHRARTEAPSALPHYSLARIYEHVAVITFYGLVYVALITLLYAVITYIRADDPPLGFQEPRGTVLREASAFVVAVLVISIPALAAHLWLVRRRLLAASPEGPERRVVAQFQMGLLSLIAVGSGLIAAFSVVVLVFELTGQAFDIGGVGRDLSTFGLSALPISLLSIAVVYAGLWKSPEFQRSRALL